MLLHVPYFRRSIVHESLSNDMLVEGEAEVKFNSRGVLHKIQKPILLINGSADFCFRLEDIQETARLIPNCASIVYEGETHISTCMDKRLPTDILEFVRSSKAK